ncbi:hypothetical protein CPHO_01235 [Corynebacterium phocae]|uniref:Antitoxin SocA-like Panacea domain-containing protein n=1 Tax=Corynebacterium phocae TaxID=161895 RepID=A0A1L7D0U2_9CORY|nr:type II toxin-antitoxin system antitoxin SocA domain-containing protein [Corynebacterium phocae]APT91769.1 hypothetical protein CPHO_01235 [Corynebacterium phocae]KAA8728539.1 DUF4065 domain-containing protein [Corynebacterium phocae]
MANIFDVSQYLLKLRPDLTEIELHKLCFFAQGWHTAWTGQPLFPDEMEAWKHGPVSPQLRRCRRVAGNRVTRIDAGNSDNLSEYERRVIKMVEEFYQNKPAFGADGMSELSHGLAWRKARGELSPDAASSNPISLADIFKEFAQRLYSPEITPQLPTYIPKISLDQLEEHLDEIEDQHRDILRGLAYI